MVLVLLVVKLLAFVMQEVMISESVTILGPFETVSKRVKILPDTLQAIDMISERVEVHLVPFKMISERMKILLTPANLAIPSSKVHEKMVVSLTLYKRVVVVERICERQPIYFS